MKLSGTNLAGTSTTRERVENDYYATDPKSTKSLLENHEFFGESFLEPCCGEGHISKILEERFPEKKIKSQDLIYRNYGSGNIDFLTWKTNESFDNIITNPPYKLAQEFIEKSFELLNNNGQIAMFLKIQFLEGQKRKKFFKKYPPKVVYVFSSRQNPWRNGSPVDEKGKTWSSTMCFSWFVWEKGYKGETIIKWI
jgi:hypothetical protein